MTSPTKPIILALPFPPSVNTIWRATPMVKKTNNMPWEEYKASARNILSKKGKAYYDKVQWDVRLQMRQQGLFNAMPGRCVVCTDLRRHDLRSYDVDNYNKALLDAATHGGLFKDDKCVDLLLAARGPKTKPGTAIMVIWEIKQQPKFDDLVNLIFEATGGVHG